MIIFFFCAPMYLFSSKILIAITVTINEKIAANPE